MKLRGHLALALLLVSFVACDVAQRLAIAPWIRLRPERRIAVLGAWERLMAWLVLSTVSRIGGARIPELPRIPGERGTLVLMNHQSVLDIPLLVGSMESAYPRIVTRTRYGRWIPLISHMIRLYQYPQVDPRANASEGRAMLAAVREAARTSDVPLAVFPEGSRTRDGGIGRFRTAGLRLVLGERPWTVYVLVADGFWRHARLTDFLSGTSGIRGRIALRGPFAWPDPEGDAVAFLEEMREVMVDALAELREAAPA